MSKLRASTQALGAIVHPYQSPAMVNAGLPGRILASGKGGNANGWGLWVPKALLPEMGRPGSPGGRPGEGPDPYREVYPPCAVEVPEQLLVFAKLLPGVMGPGLRQDDIEAHHFSFDVRTSSSNDQARSGWR